MKEKPVSLSSWRARKELTPRELGELTRDVHRFFQDNRNGSVESLNRELEMLGWGIDLLDRQTYLQFQRSL